MKNNTSRGWALVTGASSGIGTELAKALAAEGHPVLLVARRQDRLRALADEIERAGGRAEVLAADLSRREDTDAVARRGLELSVEVLCNNAGVGAHGAFTERPIEELLAMVRLNLDGLLVLTHRLTPGMVARGRGRVLNVSSTAAFQPLPWFSAYAATKSFVLHFTEGLDEELRGTGVRAMALCPGPVKTEFEHVAHSVELSSRLPNLEARVVAARAMAMLRRGGAVGIVGLINWLLVQSVRVTPRSWMRRLMATLSRPPAAASAKRGAR